MQWSRWIAALLISCGAQPGSAEAAGEPANLVLRNVTLPDPGDKTADVIINLVIRNGKLDLVTEDVPPQTADQILNADGRYLLGRLHTGDTPSFLLLNADPREDFGVLLDTATHAVFAIDDGVVVKNELPSPAPPAEPESRPSRWLAYTPPPIALPTSYRDTSRWNRWETPFISGIFAGAIVLDRQRWQSQNAASRPQVGDLSSFDGGEIRGLRFGAVGTLNFPKPWVYTIFAATNAFDKGFDTEDTEDVSIFDLRLDIPLFGSTLSVGKQKEPISMERTMGLIYLPMQERSAPIDGLLPARNTGVVISGTAFDERVSWAGGLFNDWLDTEGAFDDGANQFVGRLTWLAAASADESNVLHLAAGLRYSDAKQGFRFATEPEFNQSPLYIDTSIDGVPRAAEDVMTWQLEASWRHGPLWVAGEYVEADVEAPEQADPSFHGYSITASWALTGEMRAYRRKNGTFSPLPVARSVYNNGPGAWEVAARWSVFDANSGLIEGGETDIFSLGLNWWLTPLFSFGTNYRWITLERDGLTGKSSGFAARISLMLE
jgi:phosphate-selective porin OprO/OprP